MFISVIIPAYNEEKRLPLTLEKISSYLLKTFGQDEIEIIVVDDKSKDKTLMEAEKLSQTYPFIKTIKNNINSGKGYSVRNGMLNSNGDWKLFTDADSSTPIEELDRFMEFMEDHQIIIGSRYLKSSNIIKKQPFYRIMLSRFGNLLVRFLTIKGIKDTQCGFKIFSKKAAFDIFSRQTICGWGFDVEILAIGNILGYKIKEVPVSWINDEGTRLRILRDSISTIRELITIKINILRGLYLKT